MSADSEYQEERAEFEALLASGLFDRAPSRAQLLDYVCRKYFEGQEEQIKEYNIAVEALGRPADFDPKRDSIVRVEAHRLRKRLSEFYQGEGANHRVKIVMEPGQYVPQFVRSGIDSATDAKQVEGIAVTDVADQREEAPPAKASDSEGAKPLVRWKWVLAGVVVAAVCGIAAFLQRAGASGIVVPPSPALLRGDEVRILAGWTEGPYTDSYGRVWQTDQYGTGGYLTSYTGHYVEGARDQKLFQTAREGDFLYDIPLSPGVYEMRLYFAEMLFGERNIGGGGEGSRVFNVDANGKRLLGHFDVISDANGANLADERVFKDISPDADGRLHLRFTHEVRDAMLNAIEIRPGAAGRQLPVRIRMGEHPYQDRAGRVWEEDRYYRGGHLVARPRAVSGTPDPALYSSGRCGHVTYTIPVIPEGVFSVTMRFAEGWFGTGKPVGGGAGSRLFHIFCNSQPLVRDFDIYRQAGGAERALDRTFRGLRASPQGKLGLYLQPVAGYACVDAIEVVDEGK